MTDRPRAERIDGQIVMYERGVYRRVMSKWEKAALQKDFAVIDELDAITEGQIPMRETDTGV